MLFNTIPFVFFLPLVIILYYIFPARNRWGLLLLLSYFFYAFWKVEYLVLILFSTVVDYVMGLLMGREEKQRKRVKYLVISLISNLGLLFFFKYFNFFAENFNQYAPILSIDRKLPLMEFLLPVGISFYTFQTLSYSIDVYKGKIPAEKHLGYFALYVTFFPQLVAGPIERYSRLSKQLKERHPLTYENISKGMRLVLFGLFTKMVIADNLAPVVNAVYENPAVYNSIELITGMCFYSFQIYADFFGYSLIAIGSAQLMGIKIMDNFKTPYLSTNIAEFWQRWHISLSTWFRDYVYFPLGGNRSKKLRWVINILIVFVVSGIWHGANWTFVIWGGIFGLAYLFEKAISKGNSSAEEGLSIRRIILAAKTFIIVTIAWVFFRSENVVHAMEVFNSLFSNWNKAFHGLAIPRSLYVFLALFITSEFLLFHSRFDLRLDRSNLITRWFVYFGLIISILLYAGVDTIPFIYFQF